MATAAGGNLLVNQLECCVHIQRFLNNTDSREFYKQNSQAY